MHPPGPWRDGLQLGTDPSWAHAAERAKLGCREPCVVRGDGKTQSPIDPSELLVIKIVFTPMTWPCILNSGPPELP